VPSFFRRPRSVRPAAVCGTGILWAVTGCEPAATVRPGDIRTVVIPKAAEPAPPATGPVPAGGGERSASRLLQYEVPDGWNDGGGSGMRLATLFIGPPADRLEVTVIPASGSLQGNVARWLGQLRPDVSPEELQTQAAAAVEKGETVDVDGIAATVVLLQDQAETAANAASGQAILGAMIPVDDTQAVFVKFKGDAAVALREYERFKRFVASIRREE